jgi:2-polyprenyl-6-methoxyphenol hydroxylase-like FAD-dependent oxidoreductase
LIADICIHGAGFVGQTLALHLAQSGFRVALLSDPAVPTNPASTDIRAFSLNPTSKALLEAVCAWPSGEAVTPVRAMAVHGDLHGRLQFEYAAAPSKNKNKNENNIQNDTDGALNWIVDIPALAQRLGKQVTDAPFITCFDSKDAPKAKLHVVCEGKHSQLLAQLGIEAKTTPYPQHAIATRLVCEQPHGHVARQWFNERGEVLALLPLGGSAGSVGSGASKAVARHEVALVWSVDSAHAKKLMALAPADFCAALQAACGLALGAMSLSSPLALWPLQLTQVKQWTGQFASNSRAGSMGDVWVLAGDAAHAIHPLAGQGLNLGLGDVQSLATALTRLLRASPSFQPLACWPRRCVAMQESGKPLQAPSH